jgi:hypothetical protein
MKTFWRAPSGRLHAMRNCSGNGRPRDSREVTPSPDVLRSLLAQPGRPELCKCAWRAAQKEAKR